MLTGLVRQVHHLKFLLNENSPAILTGLGVSGTVATAYLTGRASFKAAEVIATSKPPVMSEERKQRMRAGGYNDLEIAAVARSEVVSTWNKVGLVWKYYIPPVAVGVGTITCIVTANKISASRIAALAVASGISERAFQEYKDKVVQTMGDRQERNIRDEIAQDRVDKRPVRPGEVILSGAGDVLFYDAHSGRYFQSTVETVKRAENKINHELLNGHGTGSSLSEFYDEIGLPPSNYSDSVGWNDGERIEIEQSTTLSSDQRPCISIDFRPPPTTTYNRHTYG
jgi:hypothetical protein